MINFTKAHACGNDFLIIEAAPSPSLAVQLCARNTGIGADGIEFFERTGDRSGRIHLINADGSAAEISGNGTRCVAAWMAHHEQLSPGESVSIETDAGPRNCRVVHANGHHYEFAQGMGIPELRDQSVNLADGTRVSGVSVSTGNPHYVAFTDDPEFTIYNRTWQELGSEICFHLDFPEQTNVEFVRILSLESVEIRIFERGVGPTKSSGTGTCATAIASIARHGLGPHLLVRAPGGEQRVDWSGPGHEITLTGPAELVAAGVAW